MVFSSIVFLFIFLPGTLFLYYLLPHRLRNSLLLAMSLLFYAWGEFTYVFLMLASVVLNWLLGLWIDKTLNKPKTCKTILALGVVLNLLPLGFFKYGNFFVDNLNRILSLASIKHITISQIHLPIGISFFTFHAISYIIDIYRGNAAVQRRLHNLALYIAFFPQLIAGPIIRYKDIYRQLGRREVCLADFSYGIERFIFGLGKKVLLANPLGQVADVAFALQSPEISMAAAWIGATSYMLQIYFDFSGYSDMAIGLARMFGFSFLENFNYPYLSKSIQEYWRRWHISLSNWFRDYLYIPLGGSRRGDRATVQNLLVVFAICGLWHGASWTFVIWGLYHGFFLTMERGVLGRWLKQAPSIISLSYALLIVLFGFVLFRSETLGYALHYLAAMLGFAKTTSLHYKIFNLLTPFTLTVYIVALFCCTPYAGSKLLGIKVPFGTEAPPQYALLRWQGFTRTGLLIVIMGVSVCSIATGAYNPFIYFRF